MNPTELCPHCDVEAHLVRASRVVPLGQRRVTIDDERMQCPKCGEEFYTQAQADLRQSRAIEKARAEDRLLSPREIKAVRDSLGLTQREFELLLGVGEKTCVRWEAGRVCQNVATDRLIRLLAANPINKQYLAAINGVPLRDAVITPVSVRRASGEYGLVPPFAFNSVSGLLSGTFELPTTDAAEARELISGALQQVTRRATIAGPLGAAETSSLTSGNASRRPHEFS